MKKNAVFMVVMTLFLTLAGAAQAGVNDGLVAHFLFNGNANDQTGNGNNGIVSEPGPTLTADRHGNPDGAYLFNGINDYIHCPSLNINPDVLPQLTMTAWVRADDNAITIRQVVSHDDGGYDRSLGIDYRGGGVGWSAFSGNSGVLGYQPVEIGAWVFVAVVYDQVAGTVKLYVNGVKYEEPGILGPGHDFTDIGRNPSFGEYFLGAIDEVRIYNRALSDAEIQVLLADLPDLVVTTVSGPPSANEGAAIPVSFTVKNIGVVGAGASTAGVYISTDGAITTADRLLGSFPVNALGPDESQEFQNVLVTLPWDLGSASYTLGAIADINSAVPEIDEMNNALAGNIVPIVRPNLTISAVSNSASSVVAGGSLTVTATAKNLSGITSGSFKIGVFLSTKTTWDDSAVWLADSATIASLAVGRTSRQAISVKIPPNTVAGKYYILVYADWLKNNPTVGAVGESNDTVPSNTMATNALTVSVPTTDLVITAVSGPTSGMQGQNITITWTAKNQGNGAAGAFQVGLYLSVDNKISNQPGVDIFLGYADVASLAAQASTPSTSTIVTIPSGITARNYYLGAYADYQNAVEESVETNNSKTASKTIVVK